MIGSENPEALQEIEDLDSRLRDVEASLLTITHVAPVKLHEGMIRIADGTNWDPGSGAGLYIYLGAAWNKL